MKFEGPQFHTRESDLSEWTKPHRGFQVREAESGWDGAAILQLWKPVSMNGGIKCP